MVTKKNDGGINRELGTDDHFETPIVISPRESSENSIELSRFGLVFCPQRGK